MLFDRHVNLKWKYRNHYFQCRGYFTDAVGKYEATIKEYIKNQLKGNIMNNEINLKEFTDLFKGEPMK